MFNFNKNKVKEERVAEPTKKKYKEVVFDGDYIIYKGCDELSDVKVKKFLSLGEIEELTKDIVDAVFFKDGKGDIKYNPHYFDFAWKYNAISYFTDVELPDKAEEANAYIERTHVLELVHSYNWSYVFDLKEAVSDAIEVEKQKYIKGLGFGEVVKSINNLFTILSNTISGLDITELTEFAKNTLGVDIDSILKEAIKDASDEILTEE